VCYGVPLLLMMREESFIDRFRIFMVLNGWIINYVFVGEDATCKLKFTSQHETRVHDSVCMYGR
jgi:hypothetical protein